MHHHRWSAVLKGGVLRERNFGKCSERCATASAMSGRAMRARPNVRVWQVPARRLDTAGRGASGDQQN
jgi:hypothetical protein